MNIDEKLNLIGFKDFVPVRNQERDGIERKLFSSIYNDKWITVKIAKQNDFWFIEQLDDNEIIATVLSKKDKLISVEELILFFKMFYYKEEELSSYL